MRDLLSVDRVANQIRLRRSTFLGTFLLVEGSSDKFFYERFVNKQACELVSAPGKPSSKLRVIEVLDILEKSNFQGVLVIVDADFDHLTTSLINNPNLFRTDTHDRETMLVKSFALDKVIDLFGSEQGKRILFLECLLDKDFSHCLVLLLKIKPLAGQGLQNLDAFTLRFRG